MSAYLVVLWILVGLFGGATVVAGVRAWRAPRDATKRAMESLFDGLRAGYDREAAAPAGEAAGLPPDVIRRPGYVSPWLLFSAAVFMAIAVLAARPKGK